MSRTSATETERQAWSLASGHYENFTVLSPLLPRHLRRDVAILYAYCRIVDDLGDEAAGDRLTLLDGWEQDLLRCFDGTPEHPLLVALQGVIRRHRLPAEPFLLLVEANRRDQRQNRYRTWAELLDYCSCSANPVGRLYLQLLGYTDSRRRELADATCTALQLANFWQDISLDARRNRIYIPTEDLRRFQVPVSHVLAGTDTPASAALLAELCRRTRAYFATGQELLPLLPWRYRYGVRLFSMGGLAILETVQRARHTALSRRPRLSHGDKWRLAIQAFLPGKKREVYGG